MSQQIVAVLSRNPQLTSELALKWAGRCLLLIAETPEELREFLTSHRPQTFLLDFSRTQGAGTTESQLLHDLRSREDETRLLVIPPQFCSEPLAQTIKQTNATRLVQPFDEKAIELFTSEPSVKSDAESQPTTAVAPHTVSSDSEKTTGNEIGAETVLTGISRRFETNSPQLKTMLRDLEVAAKHNVTILLIGETGSGKTFLSRLIHEVSPRRNEPFVNVACGALPNELIESELFGHVKGSFTSAHADKEGKFVAAKGGSMLLDEIDVLGLEQQVKLLRVIETGEFEAVGSNITLKSQARLIVASNLNLQPLVEGGKFRPDLYYRLNMLKFEIPPLRARKADIMPLAKKFIQAQQQKHGVEIHRIERGLFDALYEYPWPGNVRELENVIQRAVIYCQDGVLAANHLPDHILSGMAGPTNDPTVKLGPQRMAVEPESLNDQIELTEKEIIEQALFHNSYSRTKTAKELGISRVTLYNKMKKYDMMK
ncbi:sigma-54 interaction domain-containing protein [Thalassoroseus pseudoceratinae]|uniref:sigma-54 interaction domain-containing protein n=1 Tax=Thalassoroseus pseudoceratinae TaxID=2713176 RepID=UPI00141F37E9|nr:sigma-54 dependent transcriptional regulator [Thalassoroseus pseudoceratinae]